MTGNDSEHSNTGNRKVNALAALLNKLDITTLIAVLFMGGGNFLVTKEDGRLTREEAERVAREVHSLYGLLQQFEDWQKTALGNHTKILEKLTLTQQKQDDLLSQLHRWQQNYKNPEY